MERLVRAKMHALGSRIWDGVRFRSMVALETSLFARRSRKSKARLTAVSAWGSSIFRRSSILDDSRALPGPDSLLGPATLSRDARERRSGGERAVGPYSRALLSREPTLSRERGSVFQGTRERRSVRASIVLGTTECSFLSHEKKRALRSSRENRSARFKT